MFFFPKDRIGIGNDHSSLQICGTFYKKQCPSGKLPAVHSSLLFLIQILLGISTFLLLGVFISLDESMRKSIRIRTFLGLPDPDPLVRGMDPVPDPSIIEQK